MAAMPRSTGSDKVMSENRKLFSPQTVFFIIL
jgi:hypothetical protein